MLIPFLVGLWTMRDHISLVLNKKFNKEIKLTSNPTSQTHPLVIDEKIEDTTFYKLPAGIDKTQLYNMVELDGSLWLGTGKGLLNIKEDKIHVYKQFSDWKHEFFQNIAVIPLGIVSTVFVSHKETSREFAGVYIFDTKKHSWHKISSSYLGLRVWHKGYLYQREGDQIFRIDSKKSWKKEALKLENDICRGLSRNSDLKVIGDDLWITGTWVSSGTRSRSGRTSGFKQGCGVIRYNLNSGKETFYGEKTLPPQTKKIFYDPWEQAVYISAYESGKLSVYDIKKDQWSRRTFLGKGRSEFLNFSKDEIWLYGSGHCSFCKYIRERRSYYNGPKGFPKKYYRDEIFINKRNIWSTFYKSVWTKVNGKNEMSTFSKLGLYQDKIE